MWYIMQSIQSKYSLSERLIRTIAAIRSFPRDNVEDLIGRVSPPPPTPRPGPGSLRNAREGNGGFVGEGAEVENPLREPTGCLGAAGAVCVGMSAPVSRLKGQAGLWASLPAA